MASRDDELDQLWRHGLAELAPQSVLPDPARVDRRRARIRLRRSLTGAGVGLMLVVFAATAAFAAPGGPGRRVQTNDVPTTDPSAGPAPTKASHAATSTSSPTVTTLPPGVVTTIPADPHGHGPTVAPVEPGTTVPEQHGSGTTVPAPGATFPPPVPPPATQPHGGPTTTTPTVPSGTVIFTLDDSGLHASPASAAVGVFDVTLVDNRSTRTGTPILYLQVHPGISIQTLTGVGGIGHVHVCARQWFFGVRLNGATTDLALRGFVVDSPECTTPVT